MYVHGRGEEPLFERTARDQKEQSKEECRRKMPRGTLPHPKRSPFSSVFCILMQPSNPHLALVSCFVGRVTRGTQETPASFRFFLR